MVDRQHRAPAVDSAYAWIDRAYRSYFDAHPDLDDRWLLEQTILTGAQRRALLKDLSTPDGARVLDVGAGFGALALDLAHARPVAVTAVDVASDKLRAARDIAGAARMASGEEPPGRCAFIAGDVYHLPFGAGAFDVAVARFVFQHLDDPPAALGEIRAALRPGGAICVVEIDDGLSLHHPESDAHQRLHAAFAEAQRRAGGDREMGRKLSAHLHDAGFVDVASRVVVQSSYEYAADGDAMRRFTLQRYRNARSEIVAADLLTAAEFDELLGAFEREIDRWQFAANGMVVVTGTAPG